MIIDTTKTAIERRMDHRRAFPIREDCTVLGGHPLHILWDSDPYPKNVLVKLQMGIIVSRRRER